MASKWNNHLMKVYREMKRKNKHVTLEEAMKKASKSYK